jgi:DnaK suppressor protein
LEAESNMKKTAARDAALKEILTERRRQLQDEVQSRIRDGRSDRQNDVQDSVEHSDADIQGEIAFTLLQMRAETLVRIDQALVRLEAGKYGSCFECEAEISEARLRALPFAVRCQACEERRERRGNAARVAQRRGNFSLFPDSASS